MSKPNAILALPPDERPPIMQSSSARDVDAEAPAARLTGDPSAAVGVDALKGASGSRPAIIPDRQLVWDQIVMVARKFADMKGAFDATDVPRMTMWGPCAELVLQIEALRTEARKLQRLVGRKEGH